MYIVADSKTGYVLSAKVHTGAAGNLDNRVGFITDRICKDYLCTDLVIYMARFYTSVLFCCLCGKDVVAVGTVNKNRKGMPQH